MTKINTMRAKLLNEKFGSNAASSFSEMVEQIMKMPSLTEKECCYGTIKNYPILYLNSQTFNNDFTNLEQAIEDNFPQKSACKQCKRSPGLTRTFQPQILIEVKFSIVFMHALHLIYKYISFLYLDLFLRQRSFRQKRFKIRK